MSIFTLLIPFIILIGILALVGFTIRPVTHFAARYITNGRSRLLFLGYALVLVIVTIYFYTIVVGQIEYVDGPIEYIEGHLKEKVKMGETVEENYPNYYEAALEGKLSEIEGIHLKEQWTLPYTGNQIAFRSTDDFVGAYVFVHRKEENDGIIEIDYYHPDVVVKRGIEFSGDSNSYSLLLEEDVLWIQKPERLVVSIARFTNEFPIRQFTGEKIFHDTSFSHGVSERIFYIQIPKHLEITESYNVHIQYLTDDEYADDR